MTSSETVQVARHRTAMRRNDLSRPMRLALEDGVISPDSRVFDYGCGHGDDLRLLGQQGIRCSGWDPVHSPETPRHEAEVVNLGYVINVIEHARERSQVLKDAWELARKVLVVSARLTLEQGDLRAREFQDGVVTSRGTFQKFYDQKELRDWIDASLQVSSVAAAPGVFYVFRNEDLKQGFLSTRQHRRVTAPGVRRSEVLYEQNRELLEELMGFVADRGRLPELDEFERAADVKTCLGSIRRAFAVVRQVTGKEDWERIKLLRSQDLLVFLALSQFSRHPRFSVLPRAVQRDVKAFFSSYKQACTTSELLLYSVGEGDILGDAVEASTVGKRTDRALYVHTSAIPHLPPVLRVYEGCARAYIGTVEGASVVKLHRLKPAVTYMTYRDFESDPHPILTESLRVELHTFDVKMRDFTDWADPPVLHRKEEYVADDFPGREKFARLTAREDREGLHERADGINSVQGWQEALSQAGFELRGHRLTKVK